MAALFTVLELLIFGLILGLLGASIEYILNDIFPFCEFFILGIIVHITIEGFRRMYENNKKLLRK